MAKPRRPKNKVNATGRSETSRFVRLDHRILSSNAYRALTPNDRSLLTELAMMENGQNNGSLYLSVRDAAARMGVVDLTAASKSFDNLQTLGFIEMTEDAHFHVKAADKSRARCWRLTWLAGPGRRAPTWNFLQCEPEPETHARKRMENGQKALKAYRRARDNGRLPVLDSDAMMRLSPQNEVLAVSDSNTEES